MSDGDADRADRVNNDLSGSVTNSVQARNVSGGVHFHGQHAGAPRPYQLPPESSHFTGRSEDLAKLDAIFEGWTQEVRPTVIVSAVAGTAGIGKTALAIHWARGVADRFPDGLLYVNLQGYGPGPLITPNQALHGFLLALGTPTEGLPEDLEGRSGLFRSLLHQRRMLVLLDNARDAEQVRPLLPASETCFVLITSRSQLSSLVVRDGAQRLVLDMLSPEESLELLGSIIGQDRLDAEPSAAGLLTVRCARLPLALRIAAEMAAARPHASLGELADELTGSARIEALATYDDDETSAVRNVFSWSYRNLTPAAARVFRLLSLPTGPEISLKAAAALADLTPAQTLRIVSNLVSANLLEIAGNNRYRFHDLIRDYAGECSVEEDHEHDRSQALHRLFSWLVATGEKAGVVLGTRRGAAPFSISDEERPSAHLSVALDSPASALGWCETEFANIVAACRQAADVGDFASAWKLPAALRPFFQLRRPTLDWIAVNEIALAAAEALRDEHAQLVALRDLGAANVYCGRHEEAYACCMRALALSQRLGEDEGWNLNNVGDALISLRRFEGAVDYLLSALRIARRSGDAWLIAHALENLGSAYLGLNRPEDAVESLRESLAIFEDLSYPFGQGLVLDKLAGTHLSGGRFGEAITAGLQASAFHAAAGNRLGEASTLEILASAFDAAGRRQEAESHRLRALQILEELGHPDAQRIRSTIRHPED
ncbi:tetratricopeptide repeat protein [Streptomyces sp. NPDC047082]|uniref:ATP-binding protein n=1 Tax=Streptomyces sp. NPDC047082 TaxID=3155259 RepID=UPI0033C44BD3